MSTQIDERLDYRTADRKRVPRTAVGIPGASVSFRAVLTETTNPYLVDRLPVAGYVQIGERDVLGGVTMALFMPDPEEEGGNTSFVHVPNARFEFTSRV